MAEWHGSGDSDHVGAGTGSTVVGDSGTAAGISATVYGNSATGDGDHSTVVGFSADSPGGFTFSGGSTALTTGAKDVSLGYAAKSYHASGGAITIGGSSRNRGSNTILAGTNAQNENDASSDGSDNSVMIGHNMNLNFDVQAGRDSMVLVGAGITCTWNKATIIGSEIKLPENTNENGMTLVGQALAYEITSDRQLGFSGGGTYIIKDGDEITGATSGATGTVLSFTATNEDWSGGNAAGIIIFKSVTGVFQSENLDVGGNLNVATTTGADTEKSNLISGGSTAMGAECQVHSGRNTLMGFGVLSDELSLVGIGWKAWTRSRHGVAIGRTAITPLRDVAGHHYVFGGPSADGTDSHLWIGSNWGHKFYDGNGTLNNLDPTTIDTYIHGMDAFNELQDQTSENIAGGDLNICAGVGTGQGLGGVVNIQAADVDATAGLENTKNTLVTEASFAYGDVNIGLTPSAKIGLFGVSSVIQPATAGTTTGFVVGSGTAANDDSTFTGGTGSAAYTMGDVVLALKQVGIMAA